MKVLITGGTGYVGTALRERVRSMGHDVRLLVRRETARADGSLGAYDVVEGNIFNTNACLRACEGRDAVIHLVGIIREFPSKGITFDEYHRVATQNIVDAARRGRVERVVHMSALGTREHAASMYHASRWAGEEIVRHSPLRWTIFRPSLIFGPGDHVIPEIVDLVNRPLVPLIDGARSLLQPVALDDVCEAMAKSLSMPETQGQTYELGGPDRIAFRDFIQEVANLLGVKIKTTNVPKWALKPLVGAFQRYPWFPLTKDQLVMLSEDNVCEVDRFVKTFKIEPRSFRKSLPELVRPFQSAASSRAAV